MRALAERLARAAGAVQREKYGTDIEIRTKSAAVDLVTEVDHECEALIVGSLRVERSGDAILAEEGRGDDREGARWRWIIDPIDGTTNYAHAYPRFCVSIGVELEGERADRRRLRPPARRAVQRGPRRGRDAQRSADPRLAGETDLGNALVATGFAYDVRRSSRDNIDHFIAFVKRSRAIRRDGSAALDLCYVAAGRFDGYWELKLHAWDVAAGLLMVEEAGGRVSDLSGGPAQRSGFECVASNGRVHDQMLAILRS